MWGNGDTILRDTIHDVKGLFEIGRE